MYIACACGALDGVDGDSSRQVLSPGATAFSSLSLSFLICSSQVHKGAEDQRGTLYSVSPPLEEWAVFHLQSRGR